MKKKIALFGCGWSTDYVTALITGIEKKIKNQQIDVYMFLNYGANGDSPKEMLAESAIYQLPHIQDFDGIIILGNTLNTVSANSYLQEELKKHPVPALYLNYEHSDIPTLRIDNETGMRELMEHLFQVHHIKYPLYISGPVDHQDSILRKKVFEEICAKYQCNITPKQILYSNWSDKDAQLQLLDYLAQNIEVPDAVICANDNMALGAITALQSLDYSVPEDIIVTGYDAIEYGIFVDPIPTTVSSNFEAMGGKAIELLLASINGQEIPRETLINSQLEIRQSCGCHYEVDPVTRAKKATISPHHLQNRQMDMDIYFRTMHTCIHEAATLHWLHNSLRYFYNKETSLERNNLTICLEPEFASDSLGSVTTYSAHTNVLFTNYQENPTFYLDVDIFDFHEKQLNQYEDSKIIVFLPLQTTGVFLGYASMLWNSALLEQSYLYFWARHFSQDLDLIRHNLQITDLTEKLKKLSSTDPLTGVYNRMGCEDFAYKLIQKCEEELCDCAILIADLDRMKKINDAFGHTQGDLSLRLLAHTLTTTCPDDFIVSRFGGDEFFIVGKCTSETEMEKLISLTETNLSAEVSKAMLPYQLTVSIGGFLKHPSEKLTFEECVERADSYMYQIKKKHHENL